MNDILELAADLGKRIAADPRAQRLAQSQQALAKNIEARQLISDYEKQQQKMTELEMAGKPIEPEDKRRLVELHQNVAANQILKELLKAQMDYVELMAMVSEHIERESLGPPTA